MFSALFGWLASSAFGSIMGGTFGLLNRWMDTKQKAIDHANDLAKMNAEHINSVAMKELDIKFMEREAEGAAKIKQIESDGLAEVGRFDAIGKSHQADQMDAETIKAAGWWGWLFVVVEALRKATRPVLTWVLMIAALSLSFTLIDKARPELMTDAIHTMAVEWIFMQASSVLSYWFVSRGSVKQS